MAGKWAMSLINSIARAVALERELFAPVATEDFRSERRLPGESVTGEGGRMHSRQCWR